MELELITTTSPAPSLPDPRPACCTEPKRIVLIDDSALYAESWRAVLTCRYGERVTFESYQDPLRAIPRFGPDIDLLLIDLEIPVMDGRKLHALARSRGVECRRIVILSAHDADELHELFPADSCLAVINKTEPQQQSAFLMILDSIIKRPSIPR
jgi:CheY-like chemotaxis protein